MAHCVNTFATRSCVTGSHPTDLPLRPPSPLDETSSKVEGVVSGIGDDVRRRDRLLKEFVSEMPVTGDPVVDDYYRRLRAQPPADHHDATPPKSSTPLREVDAREGSRSAVQELSTWRDGTIQGYRQILPIPTGNPALDEYLEKRGAVQPKDVDSSDTLSARVRTPSQPRAIVPATKPEVRPGPMATIELGQVVNRHQTVVPLKPKTEREAETLVSAKPEVRPGTVTTTEFDQAVYRYEAVVPLKSKTKREAERLLEDLKIHVTELTVLVKLPPSERSEKAQSWMRDLSSLSGTLREVQDSATGMGQKDLACLAQGLNSSIKVVEGLQLFQGGMTPFKFMSGFGSLTSGLIGLADAVGLFKRKRDPIAGKLEEILRQLQEVLTAVREEGDKTRKTVIDASLFLLEAGRRNTSRLQDHLREISDQVSYLVDDRDSERKTELAKLQRQIECWLSYVEGDSSAFPETVRGARLALQEWSGVNVTADHTNGKTLWAKGMETRLKLLETPAARSQLGVLLAIAKELKCLDGGYEVSDLRLLESLVVAGRSEGPITRKNLQEAIESNRQFLTDLRRALPQAFQAALEFEDAFTAQLEQFRKKWGEKIGAHMQEESLARFKTLRESELIKGISRTNPGYVERDVLAPAPTKEDYASLPWLSSLDTLLRTPPKVHGLFEHSANRAARVDGGRGPWVTYEEINPFIQADIGNSNIAQLLKPEEAWLLWFSPSPFRVLPNTTLVRPLETEFAFLPDELFYDKSYEPMQKRLEESVAPSHQSPGLRDARVRLAATCQLDGRTIEVVADETVKPLPRFEGNPYDWWWNLPYGVFQQLKNKFKRAPSAESVDLTVRAKEKIQALRAESLSAFGDVATEEGRWLAEMRRQRTHVSQCLEQLIHASGYSDKKKETLRGCVSKIVEPNVGVDPRMAGSSVAEEWKSKCEDWDREETEINSEEMARLSALEAMLALPLPEEERAPSPEVVPSGDRISSLEQKVALLTEQNAELLEQNRRILALLERMAPLPPAAAAAGR